MGKKANRIIRCGRWVIRRLPGLFYFVFLFLGMKAACQDQLCITIFLGLYCAGESIAVSIDRSSIKRRITTTEAARILGSRSHKKKYCNQLSLFDKLNEHAE